jgi:hypothetical protein
MVLSSNPEINVDFKEFTSCMKKISSVDKKYLEKVAKLSSRIILKNLDSPLLMIFKFLLLAKQ